MTRPSDSEWKKKKRTCQIVNFAILEDYELTLVWKIPKDLK